MYFFLDDIKAHRAIKSHAAWCKNSPLSLKITKTLTNGDDRYFPCVEKAQNKWRGIKSACHRLVPMMIDVHSVLLDPALKVIGTHNGTFHCDEALAVYMLKLTEAYRDAGYSF